jgi:hypothetical protein
MGLVNNVEWVRGLVCESVVYHAETFEWVFRFGPGVSLRVADPWRIVAKQFGLPRPVDGAIRAMDLLRGRPVKSFSIASTSADASIDFGDGYLLQIFNSSSGYEGWTPSDSAGRQMIAQGGGSVVTFPARSPRLPCT